MGGAGHGASLVAAGHVGQGRVGLRRAPAMAGAQVGARLRAGRLVARWTPAQGRGDGWRRRQPLVMPGLTRHPESRAMQLVALDPGTRPG